MNVYIHICIYTVSVFRFRLYGGVVPLVRNSKAIQPELIFRQFCHKPQSSAMPGAGEELSTPAVTAPDAEEAATWAAKAPRLLAAWGGFVAGFSLGNKGRTSPAFFVHETLLIADGEVLDEKATPLEP